MYLIKKYFQEYFLKKSINNFKISVLDPLESLSENNNNNYNGDNNNQNILENFLLDKSKLVITDQFLQNLKSLELFYLSGGQYQKRKLLRNQNGFFIQARNFLALLSISYNPESYFHDSGERSSKKILEETLKGLCPQIISEIKRIGDGNLLGLLTLVRKGQQLFREWKNIDHQELINHQIITYWEMEFEKENLKKSFEKGKLDSEEYEAVTEIISDSQLKILKYLKQISPQSAKDIKEGKIKPLFLNLQKIQETFKKAFWDQLREQLKEEPPNYSGTLDLLKEIRTLIIELTPNRQDLQEMISSKLDIELFNQMVSNQAFSLDDLTNVVRYLVEKIKEYQSSDMDSDWLDWRDEVENSLVKIYSLEMTLDQFLPDFFEKCFQSLEKIKKGIDDFKNFLREHQKN